ncbi:unnamed protein product, partial [Mesorhabditis belari]|uniref:Uncharacterized protein n=1 Tax=Mesorhabditis belari TaxID=2138241 RepID=A0AAF3F2Z5_9BILA
MHHLAEIQINIKVHYKAIFRSVQPVQYAGGFVFAFYEKLRPDKDGSSCEISLLRPSICQAAKERYDMLDELLWKACRERIKIEPRIGCDDGENVSESTSLIEDVDVMLRECLLERAYKSQSEKPKE